MSKKKKVLVHHIEEFSPNTYATSYLRHEYDEHPTLEEMKSWVDDGWIEHIRVIHNGRECDAIIDEEGKLKGLPVNPLATSEYHAWLTKRGLELDDVIVGNCAVLTNFDLE
jgi:hypothetical protein